jgi:hypothetical protein
MTIGKAYLTFGIAWNADPRRVWTLHNSSDQKTPDNLPFPGFNDHSDFSDLLRV